MNDLFDQPVSRRTFIKHAAVTTATMSLSSNLLLAQNQPGQRKWKKALKIGMIPASLSDKEKFTLAARCGYDGIDAVPLKSLDAAAEQAAVAKQAGCPIHGVVFGWWPPFNDRSNAANKKNIDAMLHALACAKAMQADTVLLVPTRVTETAGYGQAYEHSQKLIRELIPAAAEMRITIAIENVWNKFLLSPLEFARYLDELDSPWVKAYFDVGNIIIHGFAQDWIYALGKRIIKLDLKDFRRQGYQWKNLGEGDVNWPAVKKALIDIGFNGFMTAELKGGDESYLCDVAQRIDKLLID